ncbi:hypothetical protein FRC05_003531 [Tulasnella sp. 425]|nr:hypothetical protein FRC05_003531 [Tulasnella sp. 425]
MKYVNHSQSLPDIRLRRLELQREALMVSSQDNRCPQGADDLSPAERASPVYSSPATYAVGQIPELVELILGFASKLSLYNCLFVCKAYSNIATKHIWRDLPSAIPLLKLLGPILTMGEPGLTNPSWIRFDEQESSLWYGYGEVEDAILHVLDHCTELRYIKLPPFLEHEHLLSTVQKLRQLSSLSVSFVTPEEMVSFAEGIADSLPNLRKLGLSHRGYTSTPREQLFTPLLKLSNLVEFSIEKYSQTSIIDLEDDPPWLLTLPFLQKLSTAWPELESLGLHPPNYVHMKSLESFQDSELFPKLTYLAIDIENIIYRLTIPMSAVSAAGGYVL